MTITAQLMHAMSLFGPPAIFLGAGFEGQTAVIAGGVMANRGLISLPVVWACATAGSAAVDQALFLAGRYGRHLRFVQKARAHPAFGRALGFLERHPIAFILVFRFLYGLRAVSPVALGISDVSGRLFALLNLVAAGLWAGLFVGLGFVFGKTIERWLGHAHSWERIAALVVVAALAAWLVYALRGKLFRGRPATSP